MSAIKWDEATKKLFETGIDNGALYLQDATGAYPKGVGWNGLTGMSEKPSGAEVTQNFADNNVYANMVSTEKFAATIEAFMYPPEFAPCIGAAELVKGVSAGQQTHKPFGMCYRTKIGNDTDGIDHGYKLHLVYGAIAAPSEAAYKTVNDSPEAMTMSWEIKSTPVLCTGLKPTASLVIDSTTVDATKLAAFLKIIYGDDTAPGTDPRLPLPDEVKTLLTPAAG